MYFINNIKSLFLIIMMLKKGLVYDTYNDWKFDIHAKLPGIAF
ncbi:hypothetical protein UUR10_0382 [Ureaplasma urealyticum serovar 10 str. ATCC 33699]|uniref:Uncharacterized protein n=1 Tax=Ureaplasma urealyticum serovar 10 (strain ATCC 33699 / Western) TaxID=565575 RepID=B5ZBI5_UREU1|nr:hypothetical protein UUR10_0382 [Ureaplasma urealyticum serovar 10 str. ATCC 33699]